MQYHIFLSSSVRGQTDGHLGGHGTLRAGWGGSSVSYECVCWGPDSEEFFAKKVGRKKKGRKVAVHL